MRGTKATAGIRLGGLLAWLLLVLLGCGGGSGSPAPAGGGAPGGGTPGVDAPTLDVMSYNMNWGGPSGSRLEEVADIIAASGADLVGLQEVRRFAREQRGGDYHCQDQPALLAQMLRARTGDPWTWAFAPNSEGAQSSKHCESVTSEPRAEGVAILSRYPIVSQDRHRLPHDRGLVEAYADVPGIGLVAMYSVHLHSTSQAKRVEQARLVADRVGAQARVTFLTGDMNTPPDTEEIRIFSSVARDSWPEGGQGKGFTRLSRIDYVFVRGDLRVRSAEVVQRTVSDHRPVLARFER